MRRDGCLFTRRVLGKNLHDYAKQMDVLCEYIGNKQLRDVTPTDIKAVYVHYLGYSESTIRCARILFSGLFDGAMADGYINRNPCKHESAKPHKGSVGTHRAIDTDQRVLILSTQHRLRAAVMAMLYAGLRRGEAMAIDIDRDIDFSAAIIHVREAVRFDSNQPIITTPKTEAEAGHTACVYPGGRAAGLVRAIAPIGTGTAVQRHRLSARLGQLFARTVQ